MTKQNDEDYDMAITKKTPRFCKFRECEKTDCIYHDKNVSKIIGFKKVYISTDEIKKKDLSCYKSYMS